MNKSLIVNIWKLERLSQTYARRRRPRKIDVLVKPPFSDILVPVQLLVQVTAVLEYDRGRGRSRPGKPWTVHAEFMAPKLNVSFREIQKLQ